MVTKGAEGDLCLTWQLRGMVTTGAVSDLCLTRGFSALLILHRSLFYFWMLTNRFRIALHYFSLVYGCSYGTLG